MTSLPSPDESAPSSMKKCIGLLVIALVTLSGSLAAQSPRPADGAMTLQPGDRIRISIWREEDLTGEFAVDEDGQVTLPLLGDVRVTDIPLSNLRQVLVDEYRVHLRNPSISVVPLRQVLVLGEVRNPGPYEVDPTMSVLGVIAQAGGATSAGNINRVGIIRNGTVLTDRVPVEQTLSQLDMRSGDQVFVHPRSWLARNQTFVISVLLALPSAVFTITRILE